MLDCSPRTLIRGLVTVSLGICLFSPALCLAQVSSPPEAKVDLGDEKDEDQGPVTEASVEVKDGTPDELLDEIDLAGQIFNHPESSKRERKIAVFKVKKLSDKLVIRPEATEKQKEIALQFALTYAHAGSLTDPETFKPMFDKLVKRVTSEFPRGKQGALAAYYVLYYDRIEKLDPGMNLTDSLRDYHTKYPESERGPQLFVQYCDKLLSTGRPLEAVAAIKLGAELYKENANMKKGFESLQSVIQKQVDILGTPADFTGPKLRGGVVNSRSYLGQVVILIFWGTGSPHSQAEIKILLSLYEKYHAQGLEVIGVSFDDNVENLTKFLTDNNVPWPNVFFQDADQRKPTGESVKKFSLARLPTVIAVDRNGKIAAVSIRGSDTIERIVKELLSAKPSTSGASGPASAKETAKSQAP